MQNYKLFFYGIIINHKNDFQKDVYVLAIFDNIQELNLWDDKLLDIDISLMGCII